ncbi:MAG: DUF4423 domain-containing protein [Bdellovibrionales bacterium]|nr:DUF4423 domain-containing protein [Bdellovibrionales bacterium]
MSVFEIENYKTALNSIIRDRRKSQKALSRKLAEHLNVHPSMISQVLTGNKDFSEEQMILVCEFLGLPPLESQYLLVSLQYERAGSYKLKEYFQGLRLEIRKKAFQVSERVHKNRVLTDSEKAIFYSSWLYPTVHLLTTLDRSLQFDEICERLDLKPGKAREILDFLIDLEMVVETNGILSSGPVATHLEKKSPYLVKYHTNWRLKAIQYAEQLSDQELMYSANISLSRKDFDVIREEFMATIQKFIKIVKDSPAEDIAQFNLDFFWIRK